MTLSVLSALARSDVDPWKEAEKLSQLPKAAAAKALGSLIAALPDDTFAHPDTGLTAGRLVALLPNRHDPATRSREMAPREGVATRAQVCAFVISSAVLIAIFLSSQFIIASHQAQVRPSALQPQRPQAASSSPPTSRPLSTRIPATQELP